MARPSIDWAVYSPHGLLTIIDFPRAFVNRCYEAWKRIDRLITRHVSLVTSCFTRYSIVSWSFSITHDGMLTYGWIHLRASRHLNRAIGVIFHILIRVGCLSIRAIKCLLSVFQVILKRSHNNAASYIKDDYVNLST